MSAVHDRPQVYSINIPELFSELENAQTNLEALVTKTKEFFKDQLEESPFLSMMINVRVQREETKISELKRQIKGVMPLYLKNCSVDQLFWNLTPNQRKIYAELFQNI